MADEGSASGSEEESEGEGEPSGEKVKARGHKPLLGFHKQKHVQRFKTCLVGSLNRLVES